MIVTYSYSLNTEGMAAVTAFVEKFFNGTAALEPFFSEAEEAADAFNGGYDAVIEIGSLNSVSGTPEVLRLERHWFDAIQIDDGSDEEEF